MEGSTTFGRCEEDLRARIATKRADLTIDMSRLNTETDEKGKVSLEELMVPTGAMTDALTKLLIEKGVLTDAEFTKKLLEERAVYQRILIPRHSNQIR